MYLVDIIDKEQKAPVQFKNRNARLTLRILFHTFAALAKFRGSALWGNNMSAFSLTDSFLKKAQIINQVNVVEVLVNCLSSNKPHRTNLVRYILGVLLSCHYQSVKETIDLVASKRGNLKIRPIDRSPTFDPKLTMTMNLPLPEWVVRDVSGGSLRPSFLEIQFG